MTSEEFKTYLDECITTWRDIRDGRKPPPNSEISNRDCIIYIDAFQSIRVTLFDEVLP